MIESLRDIVDRLGFGRPARRLWRPIRRFWFALHARGRTRWGPLVPEDAFQYHVRQSIETLQRLEPKGQIGPYLEFGVSRGTSMACAYHALRATGHVESRLIGFDSFKGLPPEASREGWAPGKYHSTLHATYRYLREQDVDLDQVTLVNGWFRDTLTEETRAELDIGAASLIMIDCDLHTASKAALAFCAPHIGRQAVVFFDDWEVAQELGELGQKQAFEEFLAANPDISAEAISSYRPEARAFLLQRSSK